MCLLVLCKALKQGLNQGYRPSSFNTLRKPYFIGEFFSPRLFSRAQQRRLQAVLGGGNAVLAVFRFCFQEYIEV